MGAVWNWLLDGGRTRKEGGWPGLGLTRLLIRRRISGADRVEEIERGELVVRGGVSVGVDVGMSLGLDLVVMFGPQGIVSWIDDGEPNREVKYLM